MSFASPAVLVALPMVVVLAVTWVLGVGRARRRAGALTRQRPLHPSHIGMLLVVLAGAAAVGAAAGPRWGSRTLELPRKGAEVVFILDVSRSMAATDVSPSRIEAARAAIDQAIAGLDGDRVGLVIFGGSGYLRFPPTTDLAAAREVVRSLDAGAIFVDPGSSIATGLAAAIELPSPPEEDTGRVFVLVSDGDDLGVDPVPLAEGLPRRGIELLVAGVGTASGGTVPVYDPRTRGSTEKLDAEGQPLVSRLNEDLLLRIARAAEGGYIGTDLSLLPGVLGGRLEALRDATIDERETEVPIERYQLFVVAALILLTLGAFVDRLPTRRRRSPRGTLPLAAIVALFIAVVGACSDAANPANERGLEAFAAGEYARAAELFAAAAVEQPREFQVELNRALALYTAGDLDNALAAANRAGQSARPELRGAAHAVAGHVRFDRGDLPAALESFAEALRADPLPAYRHDYEVVLRLLQPEPLPTPMPGEPTQPVPAGTPSPGTAGTPPAGQTPGPPDPNATPAAGSPGPGDGAPTGPRTLAEADDRISTIDSEIALLLAGPGEEVSREEALRIIELLAERARIAAFRESLGGGNNPRDY